MNIKLNICCLLAAVLVAGCESEAGEGHEGHEGQQAVQKSDAKLTEAEAWNVVLTKVPDGQKKEGELEKEKGKLIWSFDIAQPNAEGVAEVNVDAITGKIVAVEKKDKD